MDRQLSSVSHVVVDEIHERGVNEDLLLIVLKEVLALRPDLKVILMSATLNADKFVAFYPGSKPVHISGYTFPVDVRYLEDALAASQLQFPVPADSVRLGAAMRLFAVRVHVYARPTCKGLVDLCSRALMCIGQRVHCSAADVRGRAVVISHHHACTWPIMIDHSIYSQPRCALPVAVLSTHGTRSQSATCARDLMLSRQG